MEISIRGGGYQNQRWKFPFFLTHFLSQDCNAFASPVGPSVTKGFYFLLRQSGKYKLFCVSGHPRTSFWINQDTSQTETELNRLALQC